MIQNSGGFHIMPCLVYLFTSPRKNMYSVKEHRWFHNGKEEVSCFYDFVYFFFNIFIAAPQDDIGFKKTKNCPPPLI